MNNIPRNQHPRPDRQRDSWLCLNGTWDFEIDDAKVGVDKKFFDRPSLDGKITVPFCPESSLSGVQHTDFMASVWYRRDLEIPAEWTGKRVIFHIDASDYTTTVYVNGKRVGSHSGGYTSFQFDITDYLKESGNYVTVHALDDLRSERQIAGKQSRILNSHGCYYTRTTGIWQTVWLECVPTDYILSTKYYPDIDRKKLVIEAFVSGGEGKTLTAKASYQGKAQGEASVVVHGGKALLEVELDELYLWEVGAGRLYDLELTFGEDQVASYFGMRKIECREGYFYLNGKPVFQRLVLDQGFYPAGIYTASTLSELEADVERSLAMGFNGARLHQKVFEPLFLSYCDKKGYIVWGEHANWDLDITRESAYQNFLPEWCEIMARDFNHPAIIGWCPLNETIAAQNPYFFRLLATITRQYDSTRMYIDASGWYHQEGVTDIMDCHDYEQDPETFAKRFEALKEGGTYNVHWGFPRELAMNTYPTFVSEYGGIRWAPEDAAGWGYGNAPKSEEEFIARFKGLSEAILFHPKMGALCYTQLTDVEQEMNGLYTYDRKPKFDPAIMHAILTQKAAIEE